MSTERFNIRATPESVVVRNLKTKKDLLSLSDTPHAHIRTAVLCDSGVMLGAYGIGVAIGIENMGFGNVFDFAIATSAGANNMAYFLARQGTLGASIYYQDLPENRFVDIKRFKKIADIDFLEQIFRGETGNKKLDADVVKSARTKLLVTVTNAKTGKGELLDVQDPKIDVVTALKASMAMPVAYNQTVEINGQYYSDGCSGFALPIDYAIKNLGCNNILVILLKPYGFTRSLKTQITEAILARFYMTNASPELKKAFLLRHRNFELIMQALWNYDPQESGVNIAVICPDKFPISISSMDGSKLKTLVDQGTKQAEEIFR